MILEAKSGVSISSFTEAASEYDNHSRKNADPDRPGRVRGSHPSLTAGGLKSDLQRCIFMQFGAKKSAQYSIVQK